MKTTDKIILNQIKNYPILLYMKGSPNCPNCGFSAQAVKTLLECTKSFAYVDVLQHPDIRQALPKIANWPTFPQLWINSELIGGCDIIIEMYRHNKLQTLIQQIISKNIIQKNHTVNIKNACDDIAL